MKSNFLSESSEGHGTNLVQVMLEKGYLDVETSSRSEYYEGALVLLGKIAQYFPDTLAELWSPELNEALRKLMLPQNEPSLFANQVDQRRIISGCRFIKEWISQYKVNQADPNQADEDDEPASPLRQLQQNPIAKLEDLREIISLLLSSYLSEKSSLDLHIVLLDILMSIGPAEWVSIFKGQERTD